MRNRPKLSPGQLYSLLKEQFAAKRAGDCASCQLPLAYAITPPDDVSANWRLGTPVECPFKCQHVLAEIYLDLASRYDLLEFGTETEGDA